jgi:hypothetical protein
MPVQTRARQTDVLSESGSEEGTIPVIDHIINLCGFPDDSTMVEYIKQQGWTELTDVVTIQLDEVADFRTNNDDGSYKAKPMAHHIRKFKGFLLFYNRKCQELSSILDEEDVLEISKARFNEYLGSPSYHSDLQAGLAPSTSISSAVEDEFTAQEFRRGVKRDKNHYNDLKDDKHFNSWNRGFVATAFMHHTHYVLDENYVPRTPNEINVFWEIQTFMYAVFEEHLKTDKGKSLVSQYEDRRDAQSIYRELKKHAKSSTAAQISGDTLLKYITSARYPGNWKGTSYAFVLHWREQVKHYEKLELEDIPPKQKLRMLQNTVCDVADLANVKQLSDQIVARGEPPLNFEGYLELLLSACSTYDKSHTNPRQSGQRNVYAATMENDGEVFYDVNNTETFHVDTDISEILANTSSMRPLAKSTPSGGTSSFIPREEWLKLSKEQRDELVAKRRKERGIQQ